MRVLKGLSIQALFILALAILNDGHGSMAYAQKLVPARVGV